MSKKYDSIDKSVLKSIPNPEERPYEIKIKQPEFTFLGIPHQPDFAILYILMYPGKKIIELKSLKDYLLQFRDVSISYERAVNLVYNHIKEVYEPMRLRLVMDCNPRGGITSRLTLGSDWGIMGGEDKYGGCEERLW